MTRRDVSECTLLCADKGLSAQGPLQAWRWSVQLYWLPVVEETCLPSHRVDDCMPATTSLRKWWAAEETGQQSASGVVCWAAI